MNGNNQVNERPEIPGHITHTEYFDCLLKDRVNMSPIPKISGLYANIQFEITDKGNGTWNVVVEDGLVKKVSKWGDEKPNCAFKLDSATFISILRREITPQQAFFKGKIDISGDLLLALKMNILVNYL